MKREEEHDTIKPDIQAWNRSMVARASLVAKMGKNPPAMEETWFDPWVGKSPWRREWQPCQYSGMENSMDRGVWQAIVHLFSAVQSLCCV